MSNAFSSDVDVTFRGMVHGMVTIPSTRLHFRKKSAKYMQVWGGTVQAKATDLALNAGLCRESRTGADSDES
jgi:hypothetical protein